MMERRGAGGEGGRLAEREKEGVAFLTIAWGGGGCEERRMTGGSYKVL